MIGSHQHRTLARNPIERTAFHVVADVEQPESLLQDVVRVAHGACLAVQFAHAPQGEYPVQRGHQWRQQTGQRPRKKRAHGEGWGCGWRGHLPRIRRSCCRVINAG